MQMSCEGREADLTGRECAKNGELLVRWVGYRTHPLEHRCLYHARSGDVGQETRAVLTACAMACPPITRTPQR